MAASITDYLAGQKPSTTALDPSAAQSGTAKGRSTLNSSRDTFLKLLTAQLKNQDPLSPMDTNSFTQQLVQMNGVEQQLLTNDLLQSLVTQGSSGRNLDAVGLIGKEITAQSADATLKNGAAKWTYELDSTAARGSLEIYDAKGKLVASKPLSLDAGQHDLEWDGKNVDGQTQADGVYTLKIKAYTSDDKLIASRSYVTAQATALENGDDGTLIRMGSVKVPLSAIQSVRDLSAA
jgi:flagellar basal-body rod modification protein FlgD